MASDAVSTPPADVEPKIVHEGDEASVAIEALTAEVARLECQHTAELARAMREVEATNRSLRVAKERAEEAVRAKDAFLAGMSHELRTPLNAMLGQAQTLLEGILGSVNPRQGAALEMIESSGRDLLSLINDILDLAEAGAGGAFLRTEEVDLGAICEASVAMIAVEAVKKSLRLSIEIDPPEIILNADPRRMKQMLLNLLGNAVKYTPSGGNVSLAVHGDRGHHLVRVAVTDTGIGIAPEDLPRLFQPFVQTDSGLSRAYVRTGLGLTLVREMVELHGGSVDVVSEPGHGSTFMVTVPWPERCLGGSSSESGGEGSLPSAEPPSLHTILLAEDDADNIAMLRPYLEAKGFRVLVVEDGVEAVRAARDLRPDVILMDIQMPGMDGLEATRLIRAEEGEVRVPIIALTALAMPGDKARCLAAGATHYVTKPAHLQQLVGLLDELLGRSLRVPVPSKSDPWITRE